MLKKYKAASLAVILFAALAILLFTNLNSFTANQEEAAVSPDAGEIEEPEETEAAAGPEADEEPEVAEDEIAAGIEDSKNADKPEPGDEAVFAPTANPYDVYIGALENEKPVVLEFYAET